MPKSFHGEKRRATRLPLNRSLIRTKRYYSPSSLTETKKLLERHYKPRFHYPKKRRSWSWHRATKNDDKPYCLALSEEKQHESLCGARASKERSIKLGCTKQRHYSLPLSPSTYRNAKSGKRYYITVWQPGTVNQASYIEYHFFQRYTIY